jgi:pimeloyl-ACP methyl ester carboxylesterase
MAKQGQMAVDEGHFALGSHQTWYRRVSPSGPPDGRVPVVVIHGGPGMSSDYLASLESLADEGRTVIRYDQLGCGRSTLSKGVVIDGFGPFLEELDAVRDHLGLERVHILGHSWGGMLALEYMLSSPSGVISLVLASAPFSVPRWEAEMARLRSELPLKNDAALRRCEAHLRLRAPRHKGWKAPNEAVLRLGARALRAGYRVGSRPSIQAAARATAIIPGLRSASYQILQLEFLRRHTCRLSNPPLDLFRSEFAMNREIYDSLWGPSEFHPTGTLRGWDRTQDLKTITVPTLVTSGRHDEATPDQMAELENALPNCRSVLFEQSAHLAHLEETELYLDVVHEFLNAADR